MPDTTLSSAKPAASKRPASGALRTAVVFVIVGLFLWTGSMWLHNALVHQPLSALPTTDFQEFYCAGQGVLNHTDPYRVEPLRTCIHRLPNASAPAWLVTPAPLPGYALAMFGAFATLPFGIAQAAYSALLVACVLIAALALGRLTGWSPLLTLLVLIPTDAFLNLRYGEFVPIVIAALCVAALSLERGSVAIPALCAGIALIEPHVGLPALLALFVAIPRARVWVAGVAVVLASVSVAAIGLQANIEYFRFVLPLQALAEVGANDQYSLTHVLATLGVSPSLAITLGTISYVIMLVLGIAAAVQLGKQRRLAYIILLPPAAILLGGTFVHDVQLVAALPLALLLASDVPAFAPWVAGAIVLLLLPATAPRLASYPTPALAALLATVALGWAVARTLAVRGRLIVLGTQAVVIGAVAVFLVAGSHRPQPPVSSTVVALAAPSVSPDDYAPVVWAAYLRENAESTKSSPRYVFEKLPGWFALAVILACAFRLTLKPSGSESAPVRLARADWSRSESA